ncbi:hypothetical protein Lser_V15G46368 [Lactuca serriola]
MEGVPPDLEPDIIMRKKGKNAKVKNKLKIVQDSDSMQLIDSSQAKSVSSLVNKFESEAIPISSIIPSEAGNADNSKLVSMTFDSLSEVKNEVILPNCSKSNLQFPPDVANLKNHDSPCLFNSENSKLVSMALDSPLAVKNEDIIPNSSNLNPQYLPDVANLKNHVSPCLFNTECSSPSVIFHSSLNPTKVMTDSIEVLSQSVVEFEKDIVQLCSPGEKNSMIAFWNGLSVKEKEGFVHGLRFTKKKYNNGIETDDDKMDAIDDVKKISLVSQRNEILMNWKDLSDKKKGKIIHKLCTSKVKKMAEANFGKNRIPIKSSCSLFPSSVSMKISSEFEASDGLQKVGETVIKLFPEGDPKLNLNEPVSVDLQEICSLQSVVKEKKEKRKIEIDEMVSKQLEQVCNEIKFHFPSKFNHIEIGKKGMFNFNYADPDDKGINVQMMVDEEEDKKGSIRNSNGGLLITENMLEQMKNGEIKNKVNMNVHTMSLDESKINEPMSYAEKVSGKKLNAANLISKVKKNADLPDGVVEMPICDILKGCSPFKTTLYGYFIDKHVNFFNVNKFAHNTWRKHGLEEVMVNDEGIYFFRFSTEQGMISVLEGGVWMIFDSALVVRRWTTGVSSAKDQHDKVPVWVKIYNVPLEYWNGTGLSHIAWEIGKPLDVDAHTAKMCQEHWGRPAFMRILIEMSAAKEWLKEVHVYSSDLTTGERILSKCKIDYAWNPSKCSHCKVYGHKDNTCGILLAKEVKDIENSNLDDQKNDGKKVDLMEVLIASTKNVEEDNDGFQTVVKRNKGINLSEKKKEDLGIKNQNFSQGQNGKNQGIGKNTAGNYVANQGQKGNSLEKRGNMVGNQGKKGNNFEKNGNNFGGNQWNKGKGIQGQNGKNQTANGRNNGFKFEQGQNSKSNNFSNRSNYVGSNTGGINSQGIAHVFSYNKGQNLNVEKRKDAGSGLKYVPNSGEDSKISSNFDKIQNVENFKDPAIILSSNKFDVLKDLEDDNQVEFSRRSIQGIDLDYLDSVDQMEVIGGIPLDDTNMEGFSNDDYFPSNNKYVFCSIVYAANKYIDRRGLWVSLVHHKGLVREDPWIIGGDFNVTINPNESSAGTSKFTKGMVEFLECINTLEIQDINCNGLNFTWNQKPQGNNGILKKLDRVMGNSSLMDLFPSIFASFLPYGLSDHSPIVIKIPLKAKFKVLPFKFPNVLTLNADLKVLVENHWNTDIQGTKMYALIQKLKNLKKPIRKLLKKQGHFSDNVSHFRKELEMVQADLDEDPFNSDLRNLEAIFLGELKKAYEKEECFLKQKAKIQWLKDGDNNSKFFHKMVKGRVHKSRIEAIMNNDGEWLEGEEIYKEFVEYFKNFLGNEVPCGEIVQPNTLFSKKLDLIEAAEMIKIVTNNEIKEALFDIDDDKSPGPDGFSAKFFKSLWPVIGEDFCAAVKEFFANGKILKEVNATAIALVPKVEFPGKVSDFRPISCCSVVYKCISKVIVVRIRNHLGSLVDENQSAFIPGRSITDNILISQELVRGYHRDRGFSRCALKVDIQKAYDTVSWSFLQDILFLFGFHPAMINWIMQCVSTPSYMISMNGSYHGFFAGKRGLRQGCPLSPYLFTLVMEIFNLIIQRRIKNEPFFKYHWRCKKLKLTHLCFADDLMIFCHGNSASVRVIKESLEEFACVAGLHPNFSKSHIFFGNVKANVKSRILDTLPFVEGKLPMRYLGIPLISTRLFIRDCKRLVDKVRCRLGDWRNKFLSYAGRLQLISSVLYSLPVYWASCLLIPAAITKEIEKLMKNFLWDCDESKKGRAKVAWSSICKPLEYGGLGLRNLRAWNKTILSKRIWMILSNFDSIWVKWIKNYVLKGRCFWDVHEKQDLSWSWRNLIRLRPYFRNHFCSKVGNGVNTFMWYDDWHSLGALSYVLSPREIANAGFRITDKVKDVIMDNSWFWPSEWLSLIPQLNDFQLPKLDLLVNDRVLWRKRNGQEVEFEIHQVWKDLSNCGQKVPWAHIVWFKQSIPRFSFILWLAIQERLMTQDRMRFWDKNKNLKCSLCNVQPDSHNHLFFDCNFSSFVWKIVKDKVGIRSNSHGWKELIEEFQILFKGKSIRIFIMKIAFAASVYYIWRERNCRLFRKGRTEELKIALNIFEEIRLKLIGLKGEFLGFDNDVKRKWGVPVGKEDNND